MCVLSRGVVLQEGEGGDDAGRRDVDGQLVFPHGEPGLPSDSAGLGSGLTYCWTYLGRHDMMYWPYLCRDSPFSLYWSAGFTMARLSLTASSRGANCSRVRSHVPAPACDIAHPHVWRVGLGSRDLLRPQSRRGKGAHCIAGAARGADGGAQWPAYS